MSGPLCRYCGKPIAKKTKTVWFGRDSGTPSLAGYISNRPEFPASRDEAQRLIGNLTVVSVRWSRGDDYYAKKAGHDFIWQVTTWDGLSYASPYFCSGEHARSFGILMAKGGHCTTAYTKAKEAAL